MRTNNLGYPRIGNNRELKKACESFWAGKLSLEKLIETGKSIRQSNWLLQKEMEIDWIPSNDFSFYDQVLDMTLTVGAIPERYNSIVENKNSTELDLYFAMARGFQQENLDVTAMEMTKWFDTNYHYIVPEFSAQQKFMLFSNKIVNEFVEAKKLGITTKPVLIGAVSYLLLGKEKEKGFDKMDLIDHLLPVYIDILKKLTEHGAEWVQFDEPFLAMDLSPKQKAAFEKVYQTIAKEVPSIKIFIATYFEGIKENTSLVMSLPINALHVDLVRCPEQLDSILESIPLNVFLSLGLVDGRNIWKNDFLQSLSLIDKAVHQLGTNNIILSPSCSLLHVPCDLDLETNEQNLQPEVKQFLAFAKQKIAEVITLKQLFCGENREKALKELQANTIAGATRKTADFIHNQEVKKRVLSITETDACRENVFAFRRKLQQQLLRLPAFTTTTIGSFPQTKEVRTWRANFKKGEVNQQEYDSFLKKETQKVIRWQEDIGIDVLVHGEFERNDMVEYFGEQLAGFAFTQNGWVQSYGSRCVKPPIIFGDVYRPNPMTLKWSKYAQSLTSKFVKGMLTGPVTILQWSFVRNDQPRSQTCTQIALAIRDEVCDLERAGIKIIQIDEPAIREGLPLRREDWKNYLDWAVKAFRISSSGVKDDTQIHTHMCYSEFNDIIESITEMDADVITIECSRSQMELLDVFSDYNYPNEIGPGVYDIHSPRVPARGEMVDLLKKAGTVIPVNHLWVNPDCGLKTRQWDETEKALIEMVAAAKEMRRLATQF